jgi:uncharacterized protein YdhG (YjbR/CyaY superfamily)
MNAVDEYLAAQPEPQRRTLATMRTTIASLLPRAEEALAYGMPAWQVDGASVAGFGGARNHCVFAPFSGAVTERLASELAAYDVTKGTVRFDVARPLPKPVVRKLIDARLAELAMTPDARGIARDFYADGGLKAKGRIKDGELHGGWLWWRRDGSLLRSGSFDRGRQVGEWTTYDRASMPVKATDFGR